MAYNIKFKSYFVFVLAGATEARLSEDDSEMACTGSQDLFQSAMECQSESSLQPPTPPSPQSPSVLSGFIGNRGVPIVVNVN